MLICPFSGNRFARKVLYYKYLDFVANHFHYYPDLVMPQGKYYISLPNLITLVTFRHVMTTISCLAYLMNCDILDLVNVPSFIKNQWISRKAVS